MTTLHPMEFPEGALFHRVDQKRRLPEKHASRFTGQVKPAVPKIQRPEGSGWFLCLPHAVRGGQVDPSPRPEVRDLRLMKRGKTIKNKFGKSTDYLNKNMRKFIGSKTITPSFRSGVGGTPKLGFNPIKMADLVRAEAHFLKLNTPTLKGGVSVGLMR